MTVSEGDHSHSKGIRLNPLQPNPPDIEHAGAPSKPPYSSAPSFTLGSKRGPSSPTGYQLAGAAPSGNGGIDFSGAEGYEGFEGDVEDVKDEESRTEKVAAGEARLEALDSFHLPITSTSRSGSSPIFSLSPVQFSLPDRLLGLSVNANILIMGIDPLSILIIDLERPGDVTTVELPKPSESKDKDDTQRKKSQIERVFGDPTGKHLLVGTTAGDAFYISLSGLSAGTSDGTAPSPRRARLMRLRHAVSCVAWPTPKTALLLNPAGAKESPLMTECLLGGPLGQISTLTLPLSEDLFNLKGVAGLTGKTFERDHITFYTTSDGASIDGLAYGIFKAESPAGDKSSKVKTDGRVWVLATTTERMCEMQVDSASASMSGKGGWAEELSKKYKDAVPKLQEIPGDVPRGVLRTWTGIYPTDRKGKQPATTCCWLSPSGLYYSSMPSSYDPYTNSTEAYPSASLLAYPPNSSPAQALARGGPEDDKPIALLLTEWHFLLLYRSGRLVAFSRLNERLIWQEQLSLRADEKAIGISSDPLYKTFWVHTDRSLYEVVAREEDRDVWRAKLEKKQFEEALRFARTPRQLDVIRCRQADSFFDDRRYMQAAQTYAMSSRSFEFVTLRFVDADERDALRVYLSERLDQLDKAELTQRMMLATWLVEIYLSKLNALEDIIAAEAATTVVDDMKMELTLMEEDTRNFMTTYSTNLDREVMYDLLLSHGRVDLYLFFAELLRDWSLVAEHWVTEEKWLQAIETINRQDSAELYYRFAALLMWNVPQETVDSWLRQPALDSRRLIPALLVHKQGEQNLKSMQQAIRYLRAIIDRGNVDVTIHNLLVTLVVNDPKTTDASLLEHLSTCLDDPGTGLPYYDLDYALRLCKQHERIKPCVLIYSKMGLFESSVDLALERGDLELARLNADRPEDDELLRKKLWLKIAKYVVQEQHDIKSAIKFLEYTDLLKIEDILPFFPDFVVIDDFKDEICAALEDYSAHIASLKAEMDEATRSAESIKQDIHNLKNRFVSVDANERCSHCSQQLLTRQFYVFPCQHVFHADCLITLAKDYLPSPSLRRIINLQNELIKLTSSSSARALLSQSAEVDSRKNLFGSSLTSALAAGDKLRDLIVSDVLVNAVSIMGITGNKRSGAKAIQLGSGLSETDRKRVDKVREELDGLLAGSCVLCEGSVQTLDKAFVTSADDDSSWAL